MAFRTITLSLAVALCCGVLPGQKPALRLGRSVLLSGVEGRIDHLAVDMPDQRVFLAALGNGTVEAVDFRQGQRAGQIKGLKEPQGLLYLERNNTLYVATGGDGMVRSYVARTLAPLHSISLGDDADNLRWDHETNSVMVGYGDGAIAFLPPDLNEKGKRVEVRLPAHPESFQVSANGTGLFVNLPHDQSVAWIDKVPLKVMAKWGHLGAQSNFPMAVDPGHGHILIACREPAQLLALDTKTGTVTERMSTVGDADDLFYDAVRQRVYVIGGEGFVDVVSTADGKLTSIGHIPTAAGARTGLFVPGWNKLLVAAPHRGAEPARLLIYDLQ
jgi:hypothetical protein